ncbi:MAG: N-acetylneuraminate synthase [Bacillota bacterium]|nr:N-acetylneuraminate synthase [Bacillota bacterium]
MTNKTFIIAEAGVNHNGDIKLAKELIDVASAAGVDAIKFQTFISEEVVSKFAMQAEYQKKNIGKEETQLDMVKRLELSFSDFIELEKYCQEKGILFLSTAFDMRSIEFLDSLGMQIFKIPSGEITNLPYLKKIGRLKKRVILSTGMSEISEIIDALNILEGEGTTDITVLHCNTEYPTPLRDVNLKAMLDIKEKTGKPVGYSDHTLGIEVPIAAVALGAEVIEKHFTLSREMDGPDHKASLNPDELKEMVRLIRNVSLALGKQEKKVSESERKNIVVARKSIVAKRNISAGEIFTEDNLTTKRPGNGISPMKWHEVIGMVANRDFNEDEIIII